MSTSDPTRQAWAQTTDEHRTDFERESKGIVSKCCALCVWILGIVFEIGATYIATSRIFLASTATRVIQIPGIARVIATVLLIVLAALCALLGTRLWRRNSSRKGSPALISVILASAAFVPMCIYFLSSKNAQTTTKIASLLSALVAVGICIGSVFLIGGPAL